MRSSNARKTATKAVSKNNLSSSKSNGYFEVSNSGNTSVVKVRKLSKGYGNHKTARKPSTVNKKSAIVTIKKPIGSKTIKISKHTCNFNKTTKLEDPIIAAIRENNALYDQRPVIDFTGVKYDI